MHMLGFRGILLVLAPIALGGCADSGGQDVDRYAHGPNRASLEASELATNREERDFIGGIEYAFDRELLTQADVLISIPPLHETEIFARKLFPRAALGKLGSPGCEFAEDTNGGDCQASDEIGLTMALLERPIADYRAAFRAAGIPQDRITGARLQGQKGFSYREDDGASQVEYHFLAKGMRTFLVIERQDRSTPDNAMALRRVLSSIRLEA